jgi:hypothetical protein
MLPPLPLAPVALTSPSTNEVPPASIVTTPP